MEVEVVFPDSCNAYYKAVLLDIDISGGKCLLSFDDSWKPNTWCDQQHVRYPPQTTPPIDLTSGAKVEALLPFTEGEPGGWWLATITKSKGEIAGIEFQMTRDRLYSDLVEHKFLRVPNESAPLSQMTFHHKEFKVQQEIHDFCCDPKVHSNFHNKIQALSVTYDSEKQSLVVLADDEKFIERAEMLIDMHLSDLSTQATLKSRTEKVALRLQHTTTTTTTSNTEEIPNTNNVSGLYEESFFISPEFIGFAMGKQGWNIKQAREIEGVVSIDFDDFNSMFTIKAESKEAALSAREAIEFLQEIVSIPRNLAGKVIGRQGNIVQQILEKSKVNNIKVIGDQEAKERNLTCKEVPFELVGRRKAIENAKMMLEYHLDHLREVSTILKESEEITRKLRDSGLEDVPTLYTRTPPTRGRGRGRYRGGSNQRRSDRNRPGQRGRDTNNEDTQQEHHEDEGTVGSHEESDSTEEEQQNEQNMKRDDSPVDDGNGSPDRRRRKKRNGGRKTTGPHSPTPPTNEADNEDWPLPTTEPSAIT